QFATARLGAILVNINPAYKSVELEYALNKSGVKLLCLACGFRNTDYLAILSEVRNRCPELRDALILESDWDALLAAGHSINEKELEAIELGLQFEAPLYIH